MEGLFELTEFITLETLNTMGLSLIFGSAIVLMVVQANKNLVDSFCKTLAGLPLFKCFIKKPIKTATFTNIVCYCYTAFILSCQLGYPVGMAYIVLLILNASLLSVICKGGFDYVFKGITISKENKNKSK